MHRVRVRYEYDIYTYINTPIFGTYAELWKKYSRKYAFFCADVPPKIEYSPNGGKRYIEVGYRLSTKEHLEQYGKHKAWLDSHYTYRGKPVILVFNAS